MKESILSEITKLISHEYARINYAIVKKMVALVVMTCQLIHLDEFKLVNAVSKFFSYCIV